MFYNVVKELCQKKGTTITAMLKDLGISTSRGTAWKSGINPTADILLQISKYLNVSVDYLLGNSDNMNGGNGENLNDYEMRLLNAFRSLPKDERLIWLGKFELLAAQTAEKEYKKSEA